MVVWVVVVNKQRQDSFVAAVVSGPVVVGLVVVTYIALSLLAVIILHEC